MDQTTDFAQLLDGLRAGDPAAADEAYRRFGPYLRAAVRRRLNPVLRVRFDSIDFVQDVWASFLLLPLDRYAFDGATAFIAFLQRVASNKVVEAFRRRFETVKDAFAREMPIETRSDGRRQPLAATATPSQYAIAGETLEALLDRFPPGHRQIILRLREGYSNAEIARLANVSLTTVNRVIARLHELTGV